MTRYVLPLAIVWGELLLSAFVYHRLPQGLDIPVSRGVVTFFGTPVLSLVAFLSFRLATWARREEKRRSEDLAIAWILTFLFGVHALVLAMAVGLLASLQHAMPVAVALLLVGLGPVMSRLEAGSAIGIRTPRTLASAESWTKVHRFLGRAFALAGAFALLGLWFDGFLLIVVSVLPPIAALAAAVVYGATVR